MEFYRVTLTRMRKSFERSYLSVGVHLRVSWLVLAHGQGRCLFARINQLRRNR